MKSKLHNINREFFNFIATQKIDNSVINISNINKDLAVYLENKNLIKQSNNIAEKVFCNGCEKNCYEDVETIIKHKNESIYFVNCNNNDDIGFVFLEESDLKQYKFNLYELFNLIAIAFNCNDSIKTLIANSLYKIGRCNIDNVGYTIFFILSTDNDNIFNNPEIINAVNPVVIANGDIAENSDLPIVKIEDALIFDKLIY